MKKRNIKNPIIHRYKIAFGHLKKVIAMIEEGEYCIDIIHQSLAVQAALKKADNLVMKNHIETCVVDSIKKGKVKEVSEEVMKVFEKK